MDNFPDAELLMDEEGINLEFSTLDEAIAYAKENCEDGYVLDFVNNKIIPIENGTDTDS